jgi:hypothetical protein
VGRVEFLNVNAALPGDAWVSRIVYNRCVMKRVQSVVFSVCVAFFLAAQMTAEKKEMTVKIVDRQNNETHYTYVVSGYSTATANTNVNCLGTESSVNCSASTRVNGSNIPAHAVSFEVQGATYSLQLPDGRVVVVNCESKFKERFAGRVGNRRSCRMPLVDEIQAEFSGDKVKLKWPVSIDGNKLESETYKILGIFDKKTNN